jgi:hypothetical protein
MKNQMAADERRWTPMKKNSAGKKGRTREKGANVTEFVGFCRAAGFDLFFWLCARIRRSAELTGILGN